MSAPVTNGTCTGYCVCHTPVSSCPACPCCEGDNNVGRYLAMKQRAEMAEADADRLAARLAKVVQHFRCLDDEWAALAAHDEAVKARG